MKQFVEKIFEIGLFRSIVKFHCEIGIPKEVDAVISFGVDVVQEALNDDVSFIDKVNQSTICLFFDLWLKTNPTVDPNKLLDVGARIHNRDVENVDDLIPYYVGGYFGRHIELAEMVAERVLSNQEFLDFVSRVLPAAIKINSGKWLPRLVNWILANADAYAQASGFAALANIDKKTVVCDESGEKIFRVVEKLEESGNLDEIGVALYNASKTWSINSKYGKHFEALRNRLIKSGNRKVLNVVALTDRDEMDSMSEDDIFVRLRAFGDLLKCRETYNIAIDGYLENLVKTKPELVIAILERVMREGDGCIFEDGALHQTFSAIALGEAKLKNRVVTKWLLSQEVKLWRGAQKLVKVLHRPEDIGIRVDVSQLPSDDVGRINLFRRAVGWLFWAHLTCVGYAISCLEHLSDSALSYVKPMFYDLLTMNFPDVVEKETELRAKKVVDEDPVLAFLQEQVSCHKRLENSLSKVGVINEFLPPVEDRLEYSKLESDRHRKIQEEARKRSFLGLFNCVTVLYGNGMIGKQYAADGERRIVIPFEREDMKFRIPAMMHCAELILQSELEDAMYLSVTAK